MESELEKARAHTPSIVEANRLLDEAGYGKEAPNSLPEMIKKAIAENAALREQLENEIFQDATDPNFAASTPVTPSDSAFADLLPLTAVRIAPGEYEIKSRDGRTLWRMEGAALADWVCASVSGYDAALRIAGVSPAPSLAAREAAEAAAREVIDAVWGEAKKLAHSFVKANIRNYNDHKGVESLERVYDAKRDTAQQIFNQMHNFNEARWKKPDDIVAIISRYFPVVVEEGDEDRDQCAWTLDDVMDGDVWETGCGETFQFTDGGPSDNNFAFCYKCGKRISAGRYSDHAADAGLKRETPR